MKKLIIQWVFDNNGHVQRIKIVAKKKGVGGRRERERERESYTLRVGVSGSKPEPAEAKLTPVMSSSSLRFGSKYGGNNSLRPTYEAVQCKANRTSSLERYLSQLSPIIMLYLRIYHELHSNKFDIKKKRKLPIKSVPSFPFVNLPVGTWLARSLP